MNEPRKPTEPIVVESTVVEPTQKTEAKPAPDGCIYGCMGLMLLGGISVVLFAVGVFRWLVNFAFGG
jgi:hypothetical protein